MTTKRELINEIEKVQDVIDEKRERIWEIEEEIEAKRVELEKAIKELEWKWIEENGGE